jgi:cysteine-rich repeat protein
VLVCSALCAACNGDDEGAGPTGNTKIELVISDPATASDQVLALIDFVSYRITCPASGLAPYDDSVDLAGNFEVDADRDPPVWQLTTDLPLSDCTIALWVFYEDEVICSGTESVSIVDRGDPSSPNQVDIVLECNLSVQPPGGNADIDGTFDFINGNYCPRLNWLGAVPRVVRAAVPAVTSVETYSFDPDGTCGRNCDPQICDFTANPPVCTAGPDDGLTTTFIAPAGNGTFGDPNAFETTYTCDPRFPGPTEICVVASDGDTDCDKIRCTTIVCPDLCANVDCDDGNECTRDRCNPLTGLCSNANAPNGIACNNCNSTCQAGACNGPAFTAAQNASTMNFIGSLQALNTTLVNPYSGASVLLSGTFNVNTSSYKGVGANDVLLGTNQSDVLFVQAPIGTQRICGVETIRSQNGIDAMIVADDFIVLNAMVIEGDNGNDVLWANAGNDTLRGFNGDDFLDGGPGDDVIEDGSGNNTITLWPGGGFDSITAGNGIDRVEINAIQSQILITPAANPTYAFDIFYLGTPMAQIRGVDLLELNDALIDLTTCTGSAGDLCDLCGNDALNGGEECDDGNNVDGDGCAADCVAEY